MITLQGNDHMDTQNDGLEKVINSLQIWQLLVSILDFSLFLK